MCHPAAIAIVGIAAQAAGTGMQAYGQYQSGKYQAAVAENNAKIARMQAGQRLEQAAEEKRRVGFQVAKARGQGLTGFGAGNVALGSGSVMDWDADLETTKQLEYDNIDYNAALDVWGLENQANMYEAQGDMARYSGKMGAISSVVSGTGNLLTQSALTAKTFGWGGNTTGTAAKTTAGGSNWLAPKKVGGINRWEA